MSKDSFAQAVTFSGPISAGVQRARSSAVISERSCGPCAAAVSMRALIAWFPIGEAFVSKRLEITPLPHSGLGLF
jgi:hypothetical protein